MQACKIGILGATGAVGQEMLKILEEYQIPVSELRPLASARSAGGTLRFQGKDVVIQEAKDESFRGLDFVLGAYLSKGGKSFICCSSTVKAKDGTVSSRIRPTLSGGSIVTYTRANIHYLVTEYGMVNLKGISTWEKAERIISVCHPDFRDELAAEAEKMHIWRKSNKR